MSRGWRGADGGLVTKSRLRWPRNSTIIMHVAMENVNVRVLDHVKQDH